nr:MAG TPA: hypothetical protein [Caudoviricetes sp.]
MKLSTLIDSLQKELDERGDVTVAIRSEANPRPLVTERLDTVPVINKNTGKKRLIIVSDPEWRIPDDDKGKES